MNNELIIDEKKKKKERIVQLYKNIIWIFFDYIIKVILVSVLWFFFSTPFFYMGYILVTTGVKTFLAYIWLVIIIAYSPFSFGASYVILKMVSQIATSEKLLLFDKVIDKSDIKVKLFFNGIFKFFFKSLLLILVNIFISGFLYMNIYFYWYILTPQIKWLGLLLTGLMIWLALLYILMQIYLLPLTLTKKINIFKVLYQAFLLVIDNMGFSIAMTALIISFTIIFIFTLAGFFLIYYGVIMIISLVGYLFVYQKYDETLTIKEETRSLKNVIRPWS